MSGIAAILRLDGGPPAGIEAMAARLEARGPEGTGIARDGACALAHTHLATTPEAVGERQPLRHEPSGCLLTGEIRLDNRDVLLQALGLSPGASDAALTLAAWLRWGEEAPARLEGDFAFAVWDPGRQRLFCARDRVGVRQCCYHHAPGRLFAVATLPTAVLAAEGVPRRIDEGRIGDFVTMSLEALGDGTFWQGVSRLPPAHHLTVDRSGLRIAPYFRWEEPPELRLGSDAAYEEAFREVFGRAVARRLRAPEGRVGSMLSGGTDSGSVAAVAAGLLGAEGRGPLPTISAIGPDPTTSLETRLALSSQQMPGIRTITVRHDRLGDLGDELARLIRESEEPFDWIQALNRACYLAGRRAGLSVVLDGVGGDNAMAGEDIIAQLIRRGHLGRAAAEARASSGPDTGSAATILARASRHLLAPNALRLRRFVAGAPSGRPPFVDPDFAVRVDLDGRMRAWARQVFRPKTRSGSGFAHWYRSGEFTVARERYDRIAGDVGVEARDPYSDVDVIRFGLSLPPLQRSRNGMPKVLQRRAMRGLLPADVLENGDRAHLGRTFQDAALRTGQRAVDAGSFDLPVTVRRYLRTPGPRNGQFLSNEVDDLIEGVARGLADWLDVHCGSTHG